LDPNRTVQGLRCCFTTPIRAVERILACRVISAEQRAHYEEVRRILTAQQPSDGSATY
jgi:hypothetical protein